MKSNLIKLLPFALLGAMVATICDANHVFTEALSYPNPFLFGQAAFVFPGFVIAFLFMGLNYLFAPSFFPKAAKNVESTSAGSFDAFVENLLFFMMVYLLSGFGNHEPELLSIIFYGSFLIRLAFTYERMFILLFAIILGIGGMVVEGAMTQFDLVHYRQPEIFGVPYWLGGVYMHGALALREGMRYFVYKNK
ncbi:MAG: hypothetical protein K9G46_01520 [Flavobacteriales bacterium]|jgi:hypothetical protein|nr:hypothetical protein [Flavobacteriales bacterium]